jgi:hypothetical protein
MEDPNHYPGSTRNNNRRRGRTGGNTASEIQVPKKPRMGQGKPTQADEGSKQTGTQKGKKETTQPTNGQPKQAKGARETTPNPITQEPGGNKRPVRAGRRHARNQRHNEHHQTIRSWRTMGK